MNDPVHKRFVVSADSKCNNPVKKCNIAKDILNERIIAKKEWPKLQLTIGGLSLASS